MQTLKLIQGSAEWRAHRRQHFNASDAPAMMGCSPYETRTQLMHRLQTGIEPEIDAGTQRRFDDGHRFEALARPMAEVIVGAELFPVTGTVGRYSASFDGLTMDDAIAFEHKFLNEALRVAFATGCNGATLPEQYRVQMEHQCIVSGAGQVLFMASKWLDGTLDREFHCWYTPDPKLRAKIIAGWEQFDVDLALYIPPVAAPVLVAAAQETLPAVSVKLDGSIAIIDNLDVFGIALTAYIGKINKSPQTDQDFVDLKAVVTKLEKAEAALDAAENAALASIASVNAMQSVIGTLRKLASTNRLLCDKIYKAENDRRKLEIIIGGKEAFIAHVRGLNERLGGLYVATLGADFAAVAKNLRTLASMQNAVDTELARVKIEASAAADRIQINLNLLRDTASDVKFLFADTPTIVLKANDDFKSLVENRIAAHKAEELRKEEAQRERIRAEEFARIERENAADVAQAEREAQARIDAEIEASKEPVAQSIRAQVAPEKVAQPVIAPEPQETTDKLRAFAQAVLKNWPDCMLDGEEIQEIAVEHGLLIGTVKTERCGDWCGCAEYDEFPVICYHKSQLLDPALVEHVQAVQARQAA